jgi:hypothetical protein
MVSKLALLRRFAACADGALIASASIDALPKPNVKNRDLFNILFLSCELKNNFLFASRGRPRN